MSEKLYIPPWDYPAKLDAPFNVEIERKLEEIIRLYMEEKDYNHKKAGGYVFEAMARRHHDDGIFDVPSDVINCLQATIDGITRRITENQNKQKGDT
jgi:hypothetical protein